jgi:hypothetical protein
VSWKERHTLRILTRFEMQRHMTDAGFRDVTCFGDFTDPTPDPPGGPRLLFVGRRGS